VAEDVAFGPLNLGKSRDEARQIAAETLARVGLEHQSDAVTSRLSYGQKRLVALATVLAMQPDLLLLDEPANGLDEATADRLIGILSDLSSALVVVSHHDEVLTALTDRTLYLQRGVVVAA
jgi:cobalt/nickel transport system ATP-binding protein